MSKLIKLAKEAGPGGVWSGLGTRIVMTAALVGGQFLIYGESAMMAMLAVIESVVQVSDALEIVCPAGQIKTALGAPPGVTITKKDD